MTVGPEENAAIWYLPKKLLTNVSSFFTAALKGGFSEAKTNSITLPDDDPKAFELFVQWLFCGSDIAIWCNDPHTATLAWILGDKICCPGFQNFSMLSLVKCHEVAIITPESVRLAYQKAPAGSKLRQYAIRAFFFACTSSHITFEERGLYLSVVKEVEDVGPDYVETCMMHAKCQPRELYINQKDYMLPDTKAEDVT